MCSHRLSRRFLSFGGIVAAFAAALLATGCTEQPTGPLESGGPAAPAPQFDLVGPPSTYPQVGAGGHYTCAVKTDRTIVCWGDRNIVEATPGGSFTQVSSGREHTCAVKTDKTLACWGRNAQGQAPPATEGSFRQVSSGEEHTCAVKTDETLACWGSNEDGKTNSPEGSFTQVSAGFHDTCAVKTDGTLACWGDIDGLATLPADSRFTQVSVGFHNGCAVKTDRTLACWGFFGGATPPEGSFTQVSVGWTHACAVKTDRTLVCWGGNDDGKAPPAPEGSFTQVSAGVSHTCAVKTNGTLACWGENVDGRASPPDLPARPEVEADGDAVSTDEGTDAVNTGTYSDQDGDAVTLTADVGTVVDNGDGTWSWSNPAPDGPVITYDVIITADDGEGDTAEVTFAVTVVNVAPTIVSLANDGPVAFGAPAAITVDATDPAGANDPLSYSFDCDNDDVYEIGPQAGASAACTFDATGDHTVNVLVDDGDGGTDTGSTVVTVLNQAPDVDASTDVVSADEGTDAVNTGTYIDPDGDAVTLTADVGTLVDNGDGTWSWSNPGPEGPDGYVVTITADDGNGGTADATFTVTVINLAPTIVSVANDGPVAFGAPATLTVDATDPAGANDPLSFSFDCDNDGIHEIGPQAGESAQCTFDAPGDHTVNVLVDDGDGGMDTGSTVVTMLAPTTGEVIAAVNAAVADGALVGDGPGRSAAGRLGAWRNMLNAARNALNAGNVTGACNQLRDAYLRVDGAHPPPDLVSGAAAADLAAMIQYLRDELGCAPL